MRAALLRIVSPIAVLLVFYWGISADTGAPDLTAEGAPGGLSLDDSQRLALEADALFRDGRVGDAIAQLTTLQRRLSKQ